MVNALIALGVMPSLVSVTVPPTARLGLLELLAVAAGSTKWPALALAVGAAFLAYKSHEEATDPWVYIASTVVAGGAFGWFLAGLATG